MDQPLPVYGTGENRREWIHVEDHARALLSLMEHEGLEGRVFNVGTGERRSTLEIAEAVLDAVDKPRDLISLVDDRPGHVLRHAVDSARIRIETGWTPAHTFKESLPEVVAWYGDHTRWWRATVLGSARGYFEARRPQLVVAAESHA